MIYYGDLLTLVSWVLIRRVIALCMVDLYGMSRWSQTMREVLA